MRHVVGVEILLHLAIDPELDVELLRVVDFVSGDKIRADGRKSVPRLHLEKDITRRRQTARRTVDEIHIAKHIIQSVGLGNVAGALADD